MNPNEVSNGRIPPMCNVCQEKPAEMLPVPGEFSSYRIWCSLTCAALYASKLAKSFQLLWCSIHGCWHTYRAGCKACQRAWEEKRKDRTAGNRKP